MRVIKSRSFRITCAATLSQSQHSTTMRLALLTDLHANREAFTACLEHARQQGADQYAFTGDFVGYGADPAWVVDTVMAHVAEGAIAVQGNHDYSATRAARPQMHAEA